MERPSVPAVLRALVACGWFGIQTHVGGQAIYAIARSALGVVGSAAVDVPSSAASSPIIAWLGTSAPELACYFLFWTAQVVIVCRGIESIRTLERFAAPVLIALTAALFMLAYGAAGGLGVMLSAPSAFAAGGARAGQFWSVFFPSVTAVVGFWATLSLNISDFTRYATSQKAQCAGQVIGLPVFMALFSFASIAITSCAAAAFGRVISDPIALLAAMNNGPLTTVIAMAGLLAATLSTNIAANVVAPANAFVNCAPEKISFKMGGVLTAVLGTIVAPWRFTADARRVLYTGPHTTAFAL